MTSGAVSETDRPVIRREVEILELGIVEYAQALELQHRFVEERARGSRPDTLLLLEHPHVITCGRGTHPSTLRHTPHPVFDADRGGGVTYHGPGQLVGYPIVHLKERGLPIGRYLRALEGMLIEALAAFGIPAERARGFTGVWSGGRKLASIGVGARSWVSYHGFALNVTTDLAQFTEIYPCGLQSERMTSMERLLGRAPDPIEVRREVARAFRKLLGS